MEIRRLERETEQLRLSDTELRVREDLSAFPVRLCRILFN